MVWQDHLFCDRAVLDSYVEFFGDRTKSAEKCSSLNFSLCFSLFSGDPLPEAILIPAIEEIHEESVLREISPNFYHLTPTLGCFCVPSVDIGCTQRGVALCERACFRLLSAFYDTPFSEPLSLLNFAECTTPSQPRSLAIFRIADEIARNFRNEKQLCPFSGKKSSININFLVRISRGHS